MYYFDAIVEKEESREGEFDLFYQSMWSETAEMVRYQVGFEFDSQNMKEISGAYHVKKRIYIAVWTLYLHNYDTQRS